MVAFLARMHLAVSDLVVVSGGGGCCDQGGIDHGAGLEQQAALAQNAGDHAQHLLSQFVFLQSTAEPKDGGFIGQPGEIGQLCTLPVQGNIEEGLFHGRISQGEPLPAGSVCVAWSPKKGAAGRSHLWGSTGQSTRPIQPTAPPAPTEPGTRLWGFLEVQVHEREGCFLLNFTTS